MTPLEGTPLGPPALLKEIAALMGLLGSPIAAAIRDDSIRHRTWTVNVVVPPNPVELTRCASPP